MVKRERVGLVEAAEAIGKPRKTLQRWRKAGAPFDEEGRVDVEELLAWARSRGLGGKGRRAEPEPPAPGDAATPAGEADAAAGDSQPNSLRQIEEKTARELADRLKSASSLEDFAAALREIAAGALTDTITPRKAKLLLDVSKQAITAFRKSDRTVDVLATAIDVLTPQERKLVDDYRRSKAMPPLQPGETPPPPPADEPEKPAA